jgi:hypothetical protein
VDAERGAHHQGSGEPILGQHRARLPKNDEPVPGRGEEVIRKALASPKPGEEEGPEPTTDAHPEAPGGTGLAASPLGGA